MARSYVSISMSEQTNEEDEKEEWESVMHTLIKFRENSTKRRLSGLERKREDEGGGRLRNNEQI